MRLSNKLGSYSDPATGRQLHTIACLCQALGIADPLEEQPMTIGEAGILIRRLQNERDFASQDTHASEGRTNLWQVHS